MTFNPARRQAYGSHKEAARAAACRDFLMNIYLMASVHTVLPCSYYLYGRDQVLA
jgi:hypothetical protein